MATAIVPVNHRRPAATKAAIAHDVGYALTVAAGYRDALASCGASLAGQQVLELGPGPTLGPAVCLAAAGATVTAADLYPARWDQAYHHDFYESLRERLAASWPGADTGVITRLLDARAFDPSVVRLVEAAAEGLDGLAEGGFTVVLSNAVLEHVRDVPRGLHQLARVTAPGGIHLHQIDFRDHRDFERPLEYLTIDSARFSDFFLYVRGECGNRWRHSQFLEGFQRAGFSIENFTPNLFSAPGYHGSIRGRLAPEFKTLTPDDLRILSGRILARRLPGSARSVPDEIGPPTPRVVGGSLTPPVAMTVPTTGTDEAVGALARRRPRILVVRSCRMPFFEAAVRWVRRSNADADIVALSHPGFEDALRSAGVAGTIEVRGGRFSVTRVGVRGIRRLRRERFDRVVIPQMDESRARHANLYRLAATTGAPSVVLFGPGGPLRELTGRGRWVHATVTSAAGLVRRLDVPLMLALLGIARWAPRRGRPSGDRSQRVKVLHIVSSWGVGGAQAQLAELLNQTPSDQYEVQVVVLGESDGEFSHCRLRRDDIRFTYLDWFPALAPAILEIASLCRRERFDIVHTWLFYANFLGAAGARLAGVPLVISGVRNLSLWKRAWDTRWWYRLADALGSRLPDRLTANADAVARDHADWALVPRRWIDVVPNGLDAATVRHGTSGARQWLRDELGLPPAIRLLGTVGRLAPEKDQETFIRIAARVMSGAGDIHAIVVGDGTCRSHLVSLVAQLGIADRVHFLGTRPDSRRIIAGLDTFVLTSLCEGFPNVLLEAALLGTPAVASDVGGAADVLDGDDVFPAGDIGCGAQLVEIKLTQPLATRARTAHLRQRAEVLYSAPRMAECWFTLYRGGRDTMPRQEAHG